MTQEQKKSLSKVRLDAAISCLNDAKLLFDNKSFKSSANRSYYSVFNAMRAVLAFDEIDRKKHSALISEFRRLYVKTGLFSIEDSQIIGRAFDIRTEADYDDFYVVSIEDIQEQIDGAERFLESVCVYLKDK